MGVLAFGATLLGMSSQRKAAKASEAAALAKALADKKQAYGQAFSMRQAAKAIDLNLLVSKENQKVAEMGLEDIRHQYDVQVGNRMLRGSQIEATQIAQMASSGFLKLVGTGAQMVRDTRMQTSKDVAQMINNRNKAIYAQKLALWSARRQDELQRKEARNLRVHAVLSEASGIAALQAGNQAAAGIRSAAQAQQLAGWASAINQYDYLWNRKG